MSAVKLYTIGVYGSTRAAFFEALSQADVDIVLDIRLRRAVRGAQYSYANFKQLTDELAARNIAYAHVTGLAPSHAMLGIQSAADAAAKRRKSEREELAAQYVRAYTRERLDTFDFATFAGELAQYAAPCLLCIERNPQACHRGLVAPRLADAMGASVVHLTPSGAAFETLAALRARNRKRAALHKKFG